MCENHRIAVKTVGIVYRRAFTSSSFGVKNKSRTYRLDNEQEQKAPWLVIIKDRWMYVYIDYGCVIDMAYCGRIDTLIENYGFVLTFRLLSIRRRRWFVESCMATSQQIMNNAYCRCNHQINLIFQLRYRQ